MSEILPRITEVTDIGAPELDVYARLTGAQLRNKLEAENGVFIAESPTVIEVALESGCEPISLLTEQRLINGSVKNIIDMCSRFCFERGESFPIYTASRDILKEIVGFELTRGALCAMKRPKERTAAEVLKNAKRVAVLEAVTDSTNVGALMRSAAALNIDAVLITPSCCDPLCRRAIRVSMGTVFLVPWARIGTSEADFRTAGIDLLHEMGFTTCAMALSDDSVGIDDPAIKKSERVALILGTEGTGLEKETIRRCKYTVKIPMSHGVDSLNVAAAGAIGFWEIGKA